jgi:hypothetical protein
MKDPKFMEMFMDYAKEISNPAMKKVLFQLVHTILKFLNNYLLI